MAKDGRGVNGFWTAFCDALSQQGVADKQTKFHL